MIKQHTKIATYKPESLKSPSKSGMGNSKSRSKRTGKRTEDDDRLTLDSVGSRDQPFTGNDSWTGDHELQLLRRTIEQDPELFILNNLMMSIQFFENFDE